MIVRDANVIKNRKIDTKAKVGIFWRDFTKYSGGARVAIQMYKILENMGYEAVLFGCRFDNHIFPHISSKTTIVGKNIFQNTSLAFIGDILKTLNLIRTGFSKNRCDVYILTSLYPMGLFVKKKIRKAFIIAYVHCPYSYDVRFRNLIVRYLEKKAWQYYDLIICNSKQIRDFVADLLGLRAVILYPPVDTDFFKPSWTIKRDNIILTCGGINPLRRMEFMIKMFSTYFSENYNLVITGNVQDSSYYQHLLKLTLGSKNIELIKNPSDLQLLKLYQRATIFWYLYEGEHFGLTPVEAMATGTPVVAMRGGGLNETIKNFKTGILCITKGEFVKWSRYLLQNPDIRLQMGIDARKYVEKNFSLHVFGKKLHLYLEGLH